jgi:hypothetical protein
VSVVLDEEGLHQDAEQLIILASVLNLVLFEL